MRDSEGMYCRRIKITIYFNGSCLHRLSHEENPGNRTTATGHDFRPSCRLYIEISSVYKINATVQII